MSQIAESVGIGRATLYKYFGGVETILLAWHEREIARHLEQLADVRGQGLGAVLEAFALMRHASHGRHDPELSEFLHRDRQVARAQHQVHRLLVELIREAAASGEVRDDVGPDELAAYCLHALAAARSLPSKAAVRRLVSVTVAGLRPAQPA